MHHLARRARRSAAIAHHLGWGRALLSQQGQPAAAEGVQQQCEPLQQHHVGDVGACGTADAQVIYPALPSCARLPPSRSPCSCPACSSVAQSSSWQIPHSSWWHGVHHSRGSGAAPHHRQIHPRHQLANSSTCSASAAAPHTGVALLPAGRALSTSCVLLASARRPGGGRGGSRSAARALAQASDGSSGDEDDGEGAGAEEARRPTAALSGSHGAGAPAPAAATLPLSSKQEEALRALATLRQRATVEDSLEQHVARHIMSDPMTRVMASQGMPLGISFDAISKPLPAADGTPGKASTSRATTGAGDEDVEDAAAAPRPEPRYQMEALDEIFMATRSAHEQQQQPDGMAAASASGAAAAGAAAGGGGGAAAAGGAAGGRGGGKAGDGQREEEQEEAQAGQVGAQDSWGTTREGPGEIARRLVESNRAAGVGGASGEAAAEEEDDDPSKEPLDNLQNVPGEQKYKTLEQMSADIKGLDEVFEVLAQVPWLDDDSLDQKELKGVAMVGLLGTLEEVGFNIRHQVERIWAGEHDDGMILECESARDQAALISILFHTKKIRDEYGHGKYLPPPPGAGKGAGGAAGGGKGPAISESLLQQLLTAKKEGGDGEGGKQ